MPYISLYTSLSKQERPHQDQEQEHTNRLKRELLLYSIVSFIQEEEEEEIIFQASINWRKIEARRKIEDIKTYGLIVWFHIFMSLIF